MKRFLCFLALVLLSVSAATAQTATAIRNQSLYPHPYSDNRPITKLKKQAVVQLIEPDPVSGYYHVRTANNESGFVWSEYLKVHADSGGAPTATATPAANGSAAQTTGAPVPLLAKGHSVDWWFVFKLNSKAFPGCGGTAQRACLFGGQVQQWKTFSQQFVFASSESPALQQGTNCVGDTTEDPVGATFDEVYNGSFSYVVWNDQFYGDPPIQGCGDSCSGPWGHSKGMVAWNDAGEGLVMQVTTPDWPGAGSRERPRKEEGNTLGCTSKDNDVEVSQHFFSLRLTKNDLVQVLTALQNASVVTDMSNLQVVKNGGPADIQGLVTHLGAKSTSKTVTHAMLSTGVDLISKPSNMNVPPWQMVSSVLGGVALRTATWWANPQIYSSNSDTRIDCWDSSLGQPGPVAIATTGQWAGKTFGLKGGLGSDFNHAKIGVSTSSDHHFAIFGDMNQQGTISGKCSRSQNGRGGLFYVIDNADLYESVKSLIKGDTAPTGPSPN